jgi:hypothetical protein
LPLIVEGSMAIASGTDNIIAAVGHSDRVCQLILLDFADRQLEQVLAAMQVPFPELTDLRLSSFTSDDEMPVIPDSFLGGSAPRLRHFFLDGIPFPGLPTLLLSANHLVDLRLFRIPESGYISPEAMVALLSALSSLEVLYLEFEYLEYLPDGKIETRCPPPPERSVLPVLEYFRFNGVPEYLEDLVTIIDAPQLNKLHISFFDPIDFDTQQLAQFVNRTSKLGKRDEARVEFNDRSARVLFETLEIFILCREPDLRLSSVAQVCNSSLPSTVEDLYIEHPNSKLFWQNDAIDNTRRLRLVRQNGAIENAQWLQLLLPFTTVKNLYLSNELGPGIAAALQELAGARITEVLPSLRNIFVEKLQLSGPLQENIGHFVSARRLSDHPVAISDWDKTSR